MTSCTGWEASRQSGRVWEVKDDSGCCCRLHHHDRLHAVVVVEADLRLVSAGDAAQGLPSPAPSQPDGGRGGEAEVEHADHVELQDVVELDAAVSSDAERVLSCQVSHQAEEAACVRSVLTDELHAALHLLPELHHAVAAARQQEG
jgi:hypothetical protein